MQLVRKHTFETNSSSTHTLVISRRILPKYKKMEFEELLGDVARRVVNELADDLTLSIEEGNYPTDENGNKYVTAGELEYLIREYKENILFEDEIYNDYDY